MNQQEFYEYIAQNYLKLESMCKEHIKTLVVDFWDFDDDCWFAEMDEWFAMESHVDVNFFSDGNAYEDEPKTKPIMHATAYRVDDDGRIDTKTFVRICSIVSLKELK